jgi:hypothetical protein
MTRYTVTWDEAANEQFIEIWLHCEDRGFTERSTESCNGWPINRSRSVTKHMKGAHN